MWWIPLLACAPSDTDGRPGRRDDDDDGPGSVGPQLVEGPTVVQPTVEAPYVRRVSFAFDRPVTVAGSATDGEHTIAIATESSDAPDFPLIGLYADRTWTVEVVATDDAGESLVVEPFTFTTDPLPEPWPRIDVLVSEPTVEPGYTFLPFVSQQRTNPLLVVLDARGEVAWIWSDGPDAVYMECLPTATGPVVMYREGVILELGWEGRVLRRVAAGSEAQDGDVIVEMPTFHHELGLLPDGTYLTLSTASVELDDFPLSYANPSMRGTADVAADLIVVIDPETGAITEQLGLAGLLDRERIGYDSLFETPSGLDWTHGNSVDLDEDGATWLVSLRHQDAVIAIDRASGTPRWILGTQANWHDPHRDRLLLPAGPGQWHYHQHAAKWVGPDRIVLFDNGNGGTSPFTAVPTVPPEETHSRVIQYRIDEVAGTAEQEWVFEPDPYVFSEAMGDVDVLPGGNVLATFGLVKFIGGASARDLNRELSSFQLVEFTSSGEVVWHVDVWAPRGGTEPQWHTFRAERFASFGPGGPTPP